MLDAWPTLRTLVDRVLETREWALGRSEVEKDRMGEIQTSEAVRPLIASGSLGCAGGLAILATVPVPD